MIAVSFAAAVTADVVSRRSRERVPARAEVAVDSPASPGLTTRAVRRERDWHRIAIRAWTICVAASAVAVAAVGMLIVDKARGHTPGAYARPMAKKLPADERRAQLLEAALTIAAEQGVDALTLRPLATAAGVSPGIVHYHFHDKDTLLTQLGETQILQVNEGMRLAFGQYTEPAGLTGIEALEDLLRAGAVADRRGHPRPPAADLRADRPRAAPAPRR